MLLLIFLPFPTARRLIIVHQRTPSLLFFSSFVLRFFFFCFRKRLPAITGDNHRLFGLVSFFFWREGEGSMRFGAFHPSFDYSFFLIGFTR